MRPIARFAATLLATTLLVACSSSNEAAKPTRPSPSPSAFGTTPATYPVGLVAVDGKPWVVETGSGRIGPLDDLSHAVSVGATPLRATYDGHLVWVTVFGAGEVVAIDPTTMRIVRRVKVGGQPEGIASAFGHLWVVRQKARELTELSHDGKILGSVSVGKEPRQVAAGRRALYVSDYKSGSIFRVDPKTAEVTASRHVCGGAQGMAPTTQAVWVTCTAADRVVAIDPIALSTRKIFRIAGEPDAITAVGGTVAIAATDGPTLVRIRLTPDGGYGQPLALSLGHALALADQANVDLLIIGDRFWVSSPNGGEVVSGAF